MPLTALEFATALVNAGAAINNVEIGPNNDRIEKLVPEGRYLIGSNSDTRPAFSCCEWRFNSAW